MFLAESDMSYAVIGNTRRKCLHISTKWIERNISLIVPGDITTALYHTEFDMGKAADHIRRDHEYISQRLNILQHIFMKSESTVIINKKDLLECVRFHAVFNGMCHNGKEEVILFRSLEGKGLDINNGELGKLAAGHRISSKFIKALQDSLSDNPYDLLSPEFITGAVGYIQHVESHIKNENAILLPIIDHVLSHSEQEMICELFNTYENHIMEKLNNKDITANIDYLMRKYS